ncbi:glycerol-3-phosphate 1-O-acyltransferase PlsY [Rariglobus hedericola]|uniref:Glycerol-3-phosphate acyltransferase n=1 Tax=Rariglobus hedericola TaxID=2597822 RepID=A0A556QQX9_9BACT|nr:glycerol-3-phosphate 1-O-acyltransferase PlsY [Rariglobus hedericola]TSJ79047.1 glycerol-3-phosphate 1-O-acyltransferase PlsY [Rariglobus hedericola]
MLIPLIIAAVTGYLLGAIPFGYLVARAYGINIFEHGSKSPGATNVKRVLGKKAGNTVFALDAVKGALAAGWPLLLAKWAAHQAAASVKDPAGWTVFTANVKVLTPDLVIPVAVTGLLFAVLGHSFSCFTRFKGGKGVATSAGGFIVLMPVVTLIALAVWLATFYTSRYVSLASIFAAIAMPVAAFFLKQHTLVVILAAVIGAFVIILHRANIKRLLSGTENRFVKKSAVVSSDTPAQS